MVNATSKSRGRHCTCQLGLARLNRPQLKAVHLYLYMRLAFNAAQGPRIPLPGCQVKPHLAFGTIMGIRLQPNMSQANNEVWTDKGPGLDTLHGPKFTVQHTSVAVKREFIFSESISLSQRGRKIGFQHVLSLRAATVVNLMCARVFLIGRVLATLNP